MIAFTFVRLLAALLVALCACGCHATRMGPFASTVLPWVHFYADATAFSMSITRATAAVVVVISDAAPLFPLHGPDAQHLPDMDPEPQIGVKDEQQPSVQQVLPVGQQLEWQVEYPAWQLPQPDEVAAQVASEQHQGAVVGQQFVGQHT